MGYGSARRRESNVISLEENTDGTITFSSSAQADVTFNPAPENPILPESEGVCITNDAIQNPATSSGGVRLQLGAIETGPGQLPAEDFEVVNDGVLNGAIDFGANTGTYLIMARCITINSGANLVFIEPDVSGLVQCGTDISNRQQDQANGDNTLDYIGTFRVQDPAALNRFRLLYRQNAGTPAVRFMSITILKVGE